MFHIREQNEKIRLWLCRYLWSVLTELQRCVSARVQTCKFSARTELERQCRQIPTADDKYSDCCWMTCNSLRVNTNYLLWAFSVQMRSKFFVYIADSVNFEADVWPKCITSLLCECQLGDSNLINCVFASLQHLQLRPTAEREWVGWLSQIGYMYSSNSV